MAYAVTRSAHNVEKTQTVQEQAQTIREVGDPLLQLCDTDPSVRARVGTACDTAAQAVSSVAAQPKDGQDGRGIATTTVNFDGHLILRFTDGSTQDVGRVVASDGKDGVGIVSAATVDGRLVLTFSNGSSVDVGRIVGSDGKPGENGKSGRGVSSTAVVDGRLVITYTDGSTEDAGPLPTPAPAPPPGELVVNRTDGTTVHCPRTGGPDTAPVYTCTTGES